MYVCPGVGQNLQSETAFTIPLPQDMNGYCLKADFALSSHIHQLSKYALRRILLARRAVDLMGAQHDKGGVIAGNTGKAAPDIQLLFATRLRQHNAAFVQRFEQRILGDQMSGHLINSARMREIAAERRRFGYQRIGITLEREGITMNHKKLKRLYREEGLAMKRRRGRKRATGSHRPMLVPSGPC